MEHQKLIASNHDSEANNVAPKNGQQQNGDYGALRCYGESDMEHSSDVIYLTIDNREKSLPRSDEEQSHVFTESCISDPVRRAELSARRVDLSRPYGCLQIVIGWQPIIHLTPYQDSSAFQLKMVWRLLNVLYPTFVLGLLLLAFFLQYASCYMVNIDVAQKKNFTASMEEYCSSERQQTPSAFPLRCQEPLGAVYILPGVLNIAFYLYSLILNRYIESEQVPAMIEKVMLQCSSRHSSGYLSQSSLVQSLARSYYLGIFWMVVACLVPVLFTVSEVVTLGGIGFTLLNTCSAVNVVLIVIMTVAFVLLYLSYAAMLTNYFTQSQLMIYLLLGLSERIEDANIQLPDTAISMVNDATKVLKVLNGHTASCMSLLLVTLAVDVVLFVDALARGTFSGADPLAFTVYAASVAIVIVFIAVCLLQAGRLTSACNHLKRMGHNVRARPLGYHEASQNALDSFLLYLSSLNIKARLCQVPVSFNVLWPASVITLLVVLLVFQLDLSTTSLV